jgi:hypothetical protein
MKSRGDFGIVTGVGTKYPYEKTRLNKSKNSPINKKV